MQKKIVNFNFLKKKTDFSSVFQLFTASVRSRLPVPPAVPGVLINRSSAAGKNTYTPARSLRDGVYILARRLKDGVKYT